MSEETVREFLIRILSEQHRNELEGKGYDFYLVLRHELDKINKKNERRTLEENDRMSR